MRTAVSMPPVNSWSASKPPLPAIAISGVWAATASPFEHHLVIGGKDEIRPQDQQGLEEQAYHRGGRRTSETGLWLQPGSPVRPLPHAGRFPFGLSAPLPEGV